MLLIIHLAAVQLLGELNYADKHVSSSYIQLRSDAITVITSG